MNKVEEKIIDDNIEALVHTQQPEGFIVAPMFQKAMTTMVSFIDSLT